uniref:Uncharacterized protein n=1 Tax=Sphaeramia orbicularis TaxID=375764 RepID=A0A673AZA9_9TELE
MKGVMIFLILSLVVLMAEPGECGLKEFINWRKVWFKLDQFHKDVTKDI